jgi:hypothetical protein
VAAGVLVGAAVAAVLVTLCHAAELTALALIVGAVVGGLAAHGLHGLLTRGPLRPAGDEARALAEVAAVYQQGYEVWYRVGRPSRQRERWLLYVRRKGRTWGYLDVDHMPAKHWLYVENVYVDDRHGNRGLATALLLCAASATGCRIMTTSARTRQGTRFFAKNRAVLQKYGVELRGTHP